MAQRVLRDVEVVARAGLDLETFAGEAMASLERAVPHAGACLATVDPSTLLLTGTMKFGDLRGEDDHDLEWGVREYGTPEESSFSELARVGVPALGMHAWMHGGQLSSPRMGEFMEPIFGYADELRVIASDRSDVWGGVAMFRRLDEDPFDADEVALMADLAPVLSLGIRTGLLVRVADGNATAPVGPAVVIVDSRDVVQQVSAGAQQRFDELMIHPHAEMPTGIIASLVGAARRYAAGVGDRPPRCRVRSRTGMWLVLHAAPLSSRGDSHGDVVVTIDEARPPEVVPLVVAAFDLTPREREITQLVLQGADTKEIAGALHVSVYTVQDHLKSVFSKADVSSRRELIARIYFDQYVPRLGTDVGPTGWFATSG
jgi:DNA-binding CsgD family transcriptional regulator